MKSNSFILHKQNHFIHSNNMPYIENKKKNCKIHSPSNNYQIEKRAMKHKVRRIKITLKTEFLKDQKVIA